MIEELTEAAQPDVSVIDHLLSLPGPAFLDAAYRHLLGRVADPEGREFFRNRLLQGVTRIQVIREIAGSEEAKQSRRPLTWLALELAHQSRPRTGLQQVLLRLLGIAQHVDQTERELHVVRVQLDEHWFLVEQQQKQLEIRDANADRGRAALESTLEELQSAMATLAEVQRQLQADMTLLKHKLAPAAAKADARPAGSIGPLQRLARDVPWGRKP
jgi:hypothetical protein